MRIRTENKNNQVEKKIAVWKKILFTLVIIVVIFSVLEWIASLLHEKPYMLAQGRLTAPKITDRYLFWRLEPDFDLDNGRIKTNPQGYRDETFTRAKFSGTYRIVCLGDSVTFGWNVGQAFTYPNILERSLNFYKQDNGLHQRFEVMNMGVPGYSSFQGRTLFQRETLQYQPDLVIYSFGINDLQTCQLSDAENFRRNKSVWFGVRKWAKKSELYYYSKNLLLPKSNKQKGQSDANLKTRVSVKEFRENVNFMVDKTRENGMKLIFLGQATTGKDARLRPFFKAEQEMARRYEHVNYLEAIDLLLEFSPEKYEDFLEIISKEWPEEKRKPVFFGAEFTTPHADEFAKYLSDPAHLNEIGNTIIGLEVSSVIKGNLLK